MPIHLQRRRSIRDPIRRLPGAGLIAVCCITLTAGVMTAGEAGAAPAKPVTITYQVGTAGAIHSDVGAFTSHVADTLARSNGWSLGGSLRFSRVGSNANFRLLLTSPGVLGGIAGCSSLWSCRVGQNVYINETRWNQATPTWTLGLDVYRHYVVNHEIGHYLGLGHAGCPGAGRAAPVMMQQSKGVAPCRNNVWPLLSERQAVARRYGVPLRIASEASRGYVAGAYLRTLQRWPNSKELVDQAIELDRGRLSRTGLLHRLFRDRQFETVPARVARMYESTFARPADVAGLRYWGGALQSGYPPRSMAAYFTRSSEFTNRYGNLDDAAFVDKLYRHALGRAPDPQGAQYWVGQLRSGLTTRADLLLAFSESAENRNRMYSRVRITMAYIAILNRRPDSSGLSYWSQQMIAGVPLNNILGYFRSRPDAVL